MSNRPVLPPDGARWETEVADKARAYVFPLTPDVAAKVRARLRERQSPRRLLRAAVAAVLVVLVLAALWSVPAVRAAVERIFRLGAVTIFVGEPTDTPAPSQTAPVMPTATVRGVGTPLTSALQLTGETTLEEARRRLPTALLLPAAYGEPQHVYLYEMPAPLVTLVWTEPDHPDQVRLALQIVSNRGDAMKVEPSGVTETRVGTHLALWSQGPHLLMFYVDGEPDPALTRQVNDNVLIWQQAGYTYRLETDLPMDDAIGVAESLG